MEIPSLNDTEQISFVRDTLSRLFSNKLSAVTFGIVITYLILAVSGEVYSFYCSSNDITPIFELSEFSARYQPPSYEHIFGTDYQGRDVFWRAFHGSRTAIKVGLMAAVISGIIGITLGAVAGYFGGVVDSIVVWLYSSFASIPSLLFILSFALLLSKGYLYQPLLNLFNSISATLGTDPGMMAVYLGIGMTGWVSLCRVVRAETMKIREIAYVQAAKSLGYSSPRIIIKHVLPNVMHLVIIYSTMRFAYAIMTEVIVSYLGLGVQTAPSWGVMIADGQERLWRGIWWEVGGATFFMFFLVLSLHLLGDALRDVLDPRLRDR